jgi:hypothetical protein
MLTLSPPDPCRYLTNFNKVDVLKKLDNPDDDIELEGLLSRDDER